MLAAKAKINEVEIFLDEGSYKRKSGESSEETFLKMMLLVFSLWSNRVKTQRWFIFCILAHCDQFLY